MVTFFLYSLPSHCSTYRVSLVAHVLLDLLPLAEDDRLDDCPDVVVGPQTQQYPLGASPSLGPQIGGPVHRGPEHVVHPVGVQHERRIGDVVLAGSLAQGEALLQHTEDGLRHGLGAPRLQGPPFAEPQLVHHVVVRVPALLPHGLQLVLVAVWSGGGGREMEEVN